ncbi:hypothetical protein DD594_28665, partial [Enterobacter cloacae complex sp. 4DZ1-17B1]|uniref:hypothetical protein n=1 Tax=Enterobacter cloacae complex sp. 4DZ1-17B1 TaxID=2511991 RepID=UPI0010259DC7
EFILGRPFMRQVQLIQDWRNNYLYLNQLGSITRVNLQYHTYRDVLKTPIQELDSVSSAETKLPSWLNKDTPI